MLLGHFAAGFAARRAAPRVSLGTAFLAAQLPDLVLPVLVLLGFEHVVVRPGATAAVPLAFPDFPFSHSLAAAAVWGAALAAVHLGLRRDPRAAAVLGMTVVSHWLLDLIVHRPDLPLVPGGRGFGLGLWSSVTATVAIEIGLLAAGVALYATGTRPRDRTGSAALWGLVAVLVAIFAANLLGPPPPSPAAFAWAGLGQWVFVAWGYWIDRHRTSEHAAAGGSDGRLRSPRGS